MQMIGKLTENDKADWPQLPVNFYFPTVWNNCMLKHVGKYVANIWDCLKEALKEAQAQSVAEAQRQNITMIKRQCWQSCASEDRHLPGEKESEGSVG